MINFTYNEFTLNAVKDAGHRLWNEDNVWLSDNDVTVQAIIDAFDPLPAVRADAINKVYAAVKARMEASSAGYSSAEIATFPILQKEIGQFNGETTVGPTMQTVIDRGRLTAQQLSDLITPKITLQTALLNQRDIEVAAISLQSDWTLIDTMAHITNIEAV